MCEKCIETSKESSSDFSGALEDLEPNSKSTLSSVLSDGDGSVNDFSMIRQELFKSCELTRNSFEEEFSTLIKNSTRGNSLDLATSLSLGKNKELITIDSLSKFSTK